MDVRGLTKKILGVGLLCLPLSMTTTLTGCLTDDDDPDTTEVISTEWPDEETLNAGAQAHPSVGSALELDTGKVYLSGVANTNLASVDAVVLYYGNAWHMDNTSSARAAGIANNINLTNTYPQALVKDNKFVKVTTKPVDQEAGKAAFNAGTKLSSSVIAEGDMFVLQTTNNVLVLVTIDSISGTNAGAADIMVSIGELAP